MNVKIEVLDFSNIRDTKQFRSVFTGDSKVVLSSAGGEITFKIVEASPFQKEYPVEDVDYGDYVNNRNRAVFFAYVDEMVAGEIRIRRNWNRYAYVEDLVVDPGRRRCGVGRELIKKAMEWASEAGLAGVMLETQDNNVAACLLYQHCGFEIGGFDKCLYRGLDPKTRETAIFWYYNF